MHIYLIRHTKVAVNPGICYGQTDVPLADTFRSEKEKIKEILESIQFDNVYCSPLSRCKILAESLFQKEKIVFDNRLKELNFGDWEMLTWDDIYFEPEGKVWMDNYLTFSTKNGESYAEMKKRISAFLCEIGGEKDENIAIVTHAGVIRILKSIISDQPIEKLFSTFKPNYGSVIKVEV